MFQRILVAVDGSPTSNKALVAALQLARDAGGIVRLLHAVEQDYFRDGSDFQRGRDQGEKILADGLAIAQASGVQADAKLADTPGLRLAETVAQAAGLWFADLVVVGTLGRKGFSRLLLGSGAEQVIRLAPVPVLTVRDSED